MAKPTPDRTLAIIALTEGGQKLAAQLAPQLRAEVIDPGDLGLAATLARAWPRYEGLILIMATGIVVRTIAPLLGDKRTDPGVVVVDEAGRFAISLLSGHLGGGNELAQRVAALTQGQAVITTASDVRGLTSLDLWARHHGLILTQGSLTAASATLVNRGRLRVYSDLAGELPPDFERTPLPEEAELVITNRLPPTPGALATLCPRNLVLGIGCNRSTSAAQIEQAAQETCRQNGLAFQAVSRLASIDLKRDEAGLLRFAAGFGLDLMWYSAYQLNSVSGVTPSAAALKATGAQAVAEPAAKLAAGAETLLIRKTTWKDVTIALAEIPMQLTAEYRSSAPDPAVRTT